MKQQRGYNLVEIAIVLTAFLMMSSWLASNYYQFQKDERINETERTIEQIKHAIADYAASHSVKPLVLYNSAATVTVNWQLPAGRPYLPCPDITGDGWEDREALYEPSATAITLTTGNYTTLVTTGQTGRCYSQKGLVPWRTLNTPPVDAWGNRFTYRVQFKFAHALLGFDQTTGADDSSDVGLDAPVLHAITLSGQKYAAKRYIYPVDANLTMAAPVAVTAAGWAAMIESEYAPALICSEAPCSYLTPNNVAFGEVHNPTPAAVTTQLAGNYGFDVPVLATYQPSNILNGLPVVIVSHGQNGYGAVSGAVAEVTLASTMQCKRFPSASANQDEQQNAFTAMRAGCAAIAPVDTNARQNGFVAGIYRRPDSPSGEFDDIVGWMTTEDLATQLGERRVFPVGQLPPIGLEGY